MRFSAPLALFVLIAGFISPLVHAAPPNDNRANAVVLDTTNQLVVPGFNYFATIEGGDPVLYAPTLVAPLNNVWYRWTAPVTATTEFYLNTSFDSMIFLYRVGPGGQPIFQAYNADADGVPLLHSRITSDVVAGTEYLIAAQSYSLLTGLPLQGVFRLLITQDIGEFDDFADSAPFVGPRFKAVGNSTTYSLEVGEPVHGGALAFSGRSAWISWTAPTRAEVDLNLIGGFVTLLSVYRGDDLATLSLVAESSRPVGRSTESTVRFVAEAGQTYRFAISGRANGGGFFEMTLESRRLRPGVRVVEKQVTVPQGQMAEFSVTAASSSPPAYQWQRRAKGTTNWVNLADGAGYTGSASATLRLLSADLAQNGDHFRAIVTDTVGSAPSPLIALTVTEFSFVNTSVLGAVNRSLTVGTTVPAPTNGGGYFALGLPRGLSINPATGQITGVVSSSARPGTYRVRYGSSDGNRRNDAQFVLVIEVAPFSSDMTGGFETLLHSAASPNAPMAKLSLNVTSAGRYTGRIFTFDDSKVRSIRGELVLNEGDRTAAPGATIVLARAAPFAPLGLRFQLSESDPLDSDSVPTVTASLLDGSTTVASSNLGLKIRVFPRGSTAEWAGNHNVILGAPVKLNGADLRPNPQGAGTGVAVFAGNTGRLTLRARLADNTPFTATAFPADVSHYFVANRLYSPVGGSIAGLVILTPDGVSGTYVSRPATDDNGLFWTKPAFPSSRGYREGFGPLGVSVSSSAWTAARTDLTSSLGVPSERISILGDAPIILNLEGEGVDNTDTSVRVLPVNLVLSQSGLVTLGTNPVGALGAELKLRVNAVTGQFTGTFLLIDPPVAPSIVPPRPRTATIVGNLLQDTNRGDDPLVVGAGYFLYNTFTSGGTVTQSSGLVEFLVDIPPTP
jgi:hypothetical protein